MSVDSNSERPTPVQRGSIGYQEVDEMIESGKLPKSAHELYTLAEDVARTFADEYGTAEPISITLEVIDSVKQRDKWKQEELLQGQFEEDEAHLINISAYTQIGRTFDTLPPLNESARKLGELAYAVRNQHRLNVGGSTREQVLCNFGEDVGREVVKKAKKRIIETQEFN